MVFRRIGAVALAAMLATSLAACGDDGDDDDATELEDADNGSGSSTEDDSSDSTDDTSDIDSEAIADGFFGEGCGEFGEIFVALGGAIGGAFGGPDADDADEVFEQAISDAPDEIADDMETLRDAYAEYGEALEDAGVDFSDPSSIDPGDGDALEALTEAAEVFNAEEVQEASENINAFIEEGCEA